MTGRHAQREKTRGLPPIAIASSPSLYAGLSEEEITAAVDAMAAEARATFASDLDALERRIASVDPRSLLSALSFYRLRTSQQQIRDFAPESAFSQHHVELVQAFCL